MELGIFKIEYDWYEGEHDETLLAKEVSREEFEKDLIEAKNFAMNLLGINVSLGSYLGVGYSVQCLPEYYEQIVWFMTNKKGYVVCNFDEDFRYNIDDSVKEQIGINVLKTVIKNYELIRKDKKLAKNLKKAEKLNI